MDELIRASLVRYCATIAWATLLTFRELI